MKELNDKLFESKRQLERKLKACKDLISDTRENEARKINDMRVEEESLMVQLDGAKFDAATQKNNQRTFLSKQAGEISRLEENLKGARDDFSELLNQHSYINKSEVERSSIIKEKGKLLKELSQVETVNYKINENK